MKNAEYGLLVSFIDKSQSFVNGFDCGLLWKELQTELPQRRLAHTTNVDQFHKLAEHYNTEMFIDSVDGEWCEVSFVRKRA